MKIRVAFTILALVFGLPGCWSSDGDGTESPGAKSEWALLQGVELQGRGKVPATPEFSVVDGYNLMAVASADGKSPIWVMLWPKSPPFYKQLPAGDFLISRDTLLQLKSHREVSSTVASALQSHVRTGN